MVKYLPVYTDTNMDVAWKLRNILENALMHRLSPSQYQAIQDAIDVLEGN